MCRIFVSLFHSRLRHCMCILTHDQACVDGWWNASMPCWCWLMRRAPCNVASFDSNDSWERARTAAPPATGFCSRQRAPADDARDAGRSGDNADDDESTRPDVLWAKGAQEANDRVESRRVLGGPTTTGLLVAVPGTRGRRKSTCLRCTWLGAISVGP